MRVVFFHPPRSAFMARVTIASLQQRIADLEAALASARTEIAALHIAQRPSRTVQPAPTTQSTQWPIVMMGGRRCYRVKTGWNTVAYRPVDAA
jgi:hypothetical protein